MSGKASAQWRCPQCGFEPSNDDVSSEALFRPWHVRGRVAVKAYVATLGREVREWLLALYVDKDLQLLGVDTIARGGISGCPVNFARILCRGHAFGAAGFILVHNHPSGDPTPSESDIRTTVRLRHVSVEMDMPLIDHLVVAGDRMLSVGGF